MLRIRNKPWGRIFFNLWIIVFTAIVFWAILQIQHSRVQSCKRNYEAFNEVFKPFDIPPSDLKTLRNTVQDLKSQCGKQTHLWTY